MGVEGLNVRRVIHAENMYESVRQGNVRAATSRPGLGLPVRSLRERRLSSGHGATADLSDLRFCCATNVVTASEAREPDVYRDSSNRLLGGTRSRFAGRYRQFAVAITGQDVLHELLVEDVLFKFRLPNRV